MLGPRTSLDTARAENDPGGEKDLKDTKDLKDKSPEAVLEVLGVLEVLSGFYALSSGSRFPAHPGNSLPSSLIPRCFPASSQNTARKSVVTGRSRPS